MLYGAMEMAWDNFCPSEFYSTAQRTTDLLLVSPLFVGPRRVGLLHSSSQFEPGAIWPNPRFQNDEISHRTGCWRSCSDSVQIEKTTPMNSLIYRRAIYRKTKPNRLISFRSPERAPVACADPKRSSKCPSR